MALTWIVKQTPPGPSYFLDNMNNNDNGYWTIFDPDGVGSYTGGRYVKTAADGVVFLSSETTWELTGTDWEVVLDFDVDSLVGTPTSSQYCGLRLWEPSEGKGGSFVDIYLKGKGDGDLEWTFYDGILTQSFGTYNTGSHRIRAQRQASGAVRAWIWDNSQWEWNGNTGGAITLGNAWNSGVASQMVFYDNSQPTPSILGGFDKYEQLAGEWNTL